MPVRRKQQRRRSAARESEIPDTAELTSAQRRRIIAGELQAGDVAAVRRCMRLTQAEFATALGMSRRTLQNWEQHRTTPVGSGLALLRIAAQHPQLARAHFSGVIKARV